MNHEQEWRKVREGLRQNCANVELHKKRVDLLRMKDGYPQRFNSYPGEGIPRYDEKRVKPDVIKRMQGERKW